MACDGFEGCFYAGVSREWGERAARGGEPVGVESLIFAGFEVEEVGAADGECAGGCGELDHCLGRVGGVCDGDARGVAVFVGNVVAFLQVAEFHSFPGAPSFVGDVLAGAARALGAPALGGVVCSCHLCSPFPSRFSSCPPGDARRVFADTLAYMLGARFPAARLVLCVNSKKWGTRRGLCFLAGALRVRSVFFCAPWPCYLAAAMVSAMWSSAIWYMLRAVSRSPFV